ncbi:MAG: signal peptidase II [Holosporaceae bacterium]|jgi:signal peptidase II|nr:signal peptidase II [Holosporaceae bacterium]
MPKSFSQEKLGYLLVAFLIVLGDQVSKFIVVSNFDLGEHTMILPFLNIVRVENCGVTFGLLRGVLQPLVFVVISLAIIVALCIWGKDHESHHWPVCLIVSGAVGNMIDRIVYKAVIDFLDFHLLTYHWPAFNIADSAIVVGVLVLSFISYKEEKA